VSHLFAADSENCSGIISVIVTCNLWETESETYKWKIFFANKGIVVCCRLCSVIRLMYACFSIFININSYNYFGYLIFSTSMLLIGFIVVEFLLIWYLAASPHCCVEGKTFCSSLFAAVRLAEKFVETNMLKTLGAKLLARVLPDCSHLAAGSDEYWSCYVRHMAFPLIQRLAGTCRMGPSDSSSAVVDEQLK